MNNGSLYQIQENIDCHPKVVAYYFKDWDGFEMPVHSHRAIEIMYVLSGQCTVEVGNEVCRMKSNQFILIDSRVPHQLFVEKGQPCRMLNLEFILTSTKKEYPSIKQLASQSDELACLLKQEQPYHLLKDINGVYNSLRNLVLELDNTSGDNYLMVQILISQLLLLIARNVKETINKSSQQSDLYVRKVLDYLHENYDYDVRVEQLSALTHVHSNYLHRIFKDKMGCTIIDYLTKIRIEKAKMLITQTDIPITEIAGFVGMNSSQYFSKVFKKHTNLSPLAYRRQNINHH